MYKYIQILLIFCIRKIDYLAWRRLLGAHPSGKLRLINIEQTLRHLCILTWSNDPFDHNEYNDRQTYFLYKLKRFGMYIYI